MAVKVQGDSDLAIPNRSEATLGWAREATDASHVCGGRESDRPCWRCHSPIGAMSVTRRVVRHTNLGRFKLERTAVCPSSRSWVPLGASNVGGGVSQGDEARRPPGSARQTRWPQPNLLLTSLAPVHPTGDGSKRKPAYFAADANCLKSIFRVSSIVACGLDARDATQNARRGQGSTLQSHFFIGHAIPHVHR